MLSGHGFTNAATGGGRECLRVFREVRLRRGVGGVQARCLHHLGRSGEDAFDDFSGDAGEADVEALELGGEAMVVDAEEGEHGGVEVVDVDDVFDGAVAEFVGAAPGGAGFDAGTGHEEAEGEDVVVATGALAHGGAAEFAPPEDEGVFEEAALFEVFKESGGGAVDGFGTFFHAGFEIGVMVPGAVVELDHADAALGEAAGEEAVGSEGAVAGFFDAVEVECGLGFVFEVGEFRDAALHFEGHLVLGDAGGDFGVVLLFGEEAVEALDFFDDLALGALADALGIADVVDGVAFGLELDALEAAGEDAAAPLAGGDGLGAVFAGGGEDDEAGEVLGFGAEAVEEPGAHAGAALDDGAGVHEGVGGVMIDLLRLHGADDAEFVGLFGDVGEEVAYFDAGLAVFLEVGEGASGFEDLALELGELLAFGEGFGEGLFVEFFEFGFPVEGLELGGAAGHAEEDDAFGFDGEVRGFEGAVPVVGFGEGGGSGGLLLEHGEGDAAEAVAGLFEEAAAVDAEGIEGAHGKEVLEAEFVANPLGITPKIDDCPDHCAVLLEGVKNTVRKHVTEHAVVVSVDHTVGAGCDSEAFNVGAQAARKVVAKSGFLGLIKPKAFIEIKSCLI